MPETQRDTKIRALLQSIVDAYDAGCVQLSSQDIQFDDENPPHPWHEEWLSDVRTTLAAELEAGWKKVKREYDLAERNLAMARARLTDADRAKQVEWDKMVERARAKAALLNNET